MPEPRGSALEGGRCGWALPPPHPFKAWQWIGAMGVVGLAAGLRLFRLGHQSVWFDEAFSLLVANREMGEIIRIASREFHPPLYHVSLHGWIRLVGEGELSARGLSAACGVLVVIASLWLARSACERASVILLAGLLVATQPLLIVYSQEIRSYMLSGLLAVLLVACYLRALREGGRWWWAYAGLASAALYTHYYFCLVLFSLVLDCACRRSGQLRIRSWALAHGVVAAAFAPFLPFLLAAARRGQSGMPEGYGQVSALYQVGQAVKNLFVRYPFVATRAELTSIGGLLVVLGLLGYGAALARALLFAPRWIVRPLAVAVFGPFLLALAVSSMIPVFQFHQFVPLAAFLYVLAALGVASVPDRRLRLGWGAGLILVNLASIGYFFLDPGLLRPDLRAAAAYVRDHLGTGETVLHASVGSYLPFHYYNGGRLPEFVAYHGPVLARDGRDVIPAGAALAPDDAFRRLSRSVRIWLVTVHQRGEPQPPWEPALILGPTDAVWHFEERRVFRDVGLWIFRREAPGA